MFTLVLITLKCKNCLLSPEFNISAWLGTLEQLSSIATTSNM